MFGNTKSERLAIAVTNKRAQLRTIQSSLKNLEAELQRECPHEASAECPQVTSDFGDLIHSSRRVCHRCGLVEEGEEGEGGMVKFHTIVNESGVEGVSRKEFEDYIEMNKK